MHDNTKQEYGTPIIEVLDARVERGFTLSGSTPDENMNAQGGENYRRGGEIGGKFN